MSLYDWYHANCTPPSDREAPRGPVTVGWTFSSRRSSIIFDAPQRVRSADTQRRHAKSAARCPAVINLEARYFSIPCPFDLHLSFERDGSGAPRLRNRLGDDAGLREKKLREWVSLVAEKEWHATAKQRAGPGMCLEVEEGRKLAEKNWLVGEAHIG
ncbi:MAG: hypothetical protein AAFV62_12060, partial [Pseudomonadota bacterium]